MPTDPHAGQLPDPDRLIDVPALIAAYYTLTPDPECPAEKISFGTSGHRGSSLKASFNEAHILAVTQAVCDVRRADGVTGPLFLGKDTHALSEPAWRTALEVLTANGVQVRVQAGGGFTPTPAVSHAILCWNRGRQSGLADGIVITPSHNPPADGGFKYNPPHGGPADTTLTSRIELRAGEILAGRNRLVQRLSLRGALSSGLVVDHDYVGRYVDDLASIIDFPKLAASRLKIGVNPLGGASLAYWEPVARRYGLDLTVTNPEHDPSFRFVPLDHDGKIRMDCSSPWAMSRLLDMKDSFDLAFACDPDADRHGIVTPAGLMNPNHYLSVAADYLFRTRQHWPAGAGVGKTVVTTSMLDRVAADLGRPLAEVPVGFKWFVPGLFGGTLGMGCEESAGASFLRRDGTAWSTDKDGPLLCLLAAEMTATTGKNPAQLYAGLTERFGAPLYERVDSPLGGAGRAALKALSPQDVSLKDLAGSPVRAVLTHAPGNNAPIGGIKVVSDDGWFAVRPSGTEPVCKVYMEGFRGEKHFASLREEALAFVERALGSPSA
ncbi:MAG: alpha-D-glucose phosphate-specific phosphoglucomutase [Desulfovibrionaceae bacterium]|nr:alpha-D-glucose phosphate-specific phosphoglucomutase [Desulfovibrionaceae bacterium]